MAVGAGQAIAFHLAPGQAHQVPQANPLLDRLPDVPKWIVADRGTTRHALRRQIRAMAARPAIPPRRHEAHVAYPDTTYSNRNRVKRLRARLKEGRVVATRSERPPPACSAFPASPQPSIGSGPNRP